MTTRSAQTRLLAALLLAAPLVAAGSPRPAIPGLPPDLKARADRIWAAASPAVRDWATQEGRVIAKGVGDPHAPAKAAAIQAKAGRGQGVDFSKMSVEDAVMLLMMVIAEDAQNDLRDALAEMEAARAAREKIRAAVNSLKADREAAEKREREASLRVKAATERAASVNATLANLLRQAPIATPSPTPGRRK